MDKTQTTDLKIKLYSETSLPTTWGMFQISVYRDNKTQDETILISKNLDSVESPFVRIHSECITGEVFGSLKCDCREQLNLALAKIETDGSGAVVYLRQEGRGIGLGNKIKAYALQNQGLDTIEANHKLGFGTDLREFDIAALVLKDKKVTSVKLNTNKPEKLSSLESNGIEIKERIPSITSVNSHNEPYLETKYKKLGHLLGKLF